MFYQLLVYDYIYVEYDCFKNITYGFILMRQFYSHCLLYEIFLKLYNIINIINNVIYLFINHLFQLKKVILKGRDRRQTIFGSKN